MGAVLRVVGRAAPAGLVAVAAWLVAGGGQVAAQTECQDVAVRSPFSGDVVRGKVAVLGSASIDGFGFYKVEWAPERESESWRAVSTTVAQPVRHGVLDTWDTSRLPDGLYRLKLTVVDASGQEPCSQVVTALSVANDGPPAGPETPEAAPTLVLRAARPGDLPAAGPAATPPPEAGAGEPAGATPDGEAPVAVAQTPPESGSLAPSGDFPIELPARQSPTVVARAAAPTTIDALDPGSWLGVLGVGSWPRAFAGGALAALLLAAFLALLVGLRRPR